MEFDNATQQVEDQIRGLVYNSILLEFPNATEASLIPSLDDILEATDLGFLNRTESFEHLVLIGEIASSWSIEPLAIICLSFISQELCVSSLHW